MERLALAPSVTTVPAPNHLMGRVFDLTGADVTVETNPFALRFIPDRDDKDRISKQVHDACAAYSPEDHTEDPMRWCAFRRADGSWSRAEVLCCYNDECGFVTEVEVLCIDDGFCDIVPITRIFPLDPSLLMAPPQSVRVVADGVQITNVDEASRLFHEHPEMKIRIRVRSLAGISVRPHINALKCTIELSHEESIDFGELCRRLGIGSIQVDQKPLSEIHQPEDRTVKQGDAPTTATSASDAGSSVELNPGSAVVYGELRDLSTEEVLRSRSASNHSDELASSSDYYEALDTVDPPQPSQTIVNESSDQNSRPDTGRTHEVQDALEMYRGQEEQRVRRILQQTGKIKAKNERRLRVCKEFARNGECSQGEYCPFLHEQSTTQLAVQHPSSIIVECHPIELNAGDTVFVMVSHVHETFDFYVILVYGHRSIWDVLSEQPLDTINVEQIQNKLAQVYDPIRASGKTNTRASLIPGQMVSVWLEHDELRGWHRGKLMRFLPLNDRAQVFLLDHGCQVEALRGNVFKLDEHFFEWPMQAVRCKLDGTRLRHGVSSAAVMKYLRGQLLIMHVTHQLDPANVVVTLYTESASKSVAEELSLLKLAELY
ncbi:hypothetical protein BIW11_11330 [Tropilaelaps mercedesae]|uniref:C3H1-type domain-containing protein n=1 Tax=Tropilaelaps mercedesae TaxID=418985 RepID=A0A1V9XBK0_9ACAR|nr:hypothetical protein BIW11_11330 [Tropilaelaps mercedesae]